MNKADDDLTDEGLLVSVAHGDELAYSRLVDRHLRWAMRFVVRVIGNSADAEDVVQTGFLRVWQGAATWKPSAQFRTWFYRVLYNLCMDHFRAHARTSTDGGELFDGLADNQPSQEEKLAQRQRGQLVQGALVSLPVRQRMALVLCYFEEMSQAESAALMGVSEGALESLLSRGRAAMKQKLQSELH